MYVPTCHGFSLVLTISTIVFLQIAGNLYAIYIPDGEILRGINMQIVLPDLVPGSPLAEPDWLVIIITDADAGHNQDDQAELQEDEDAEDDGDRVTVTETPD